MGILYSSYLSDLPQAKPEPNTHSPKSHDEMNSRRSGWNNEVSVFIRYILIKYLICIEICIEND